MRIASSAAAAGLFVAASATAQQVNTVKDAIAAIPAATSPSAANPAPPMPATDPGTWVRTEDYPSWAAAHGVTGSVGIMLEVDANGRVSACEIRDSSGVADFDRLACEKVTARAQFRPATDNDGNPVPSTWRNRVVWAVPEPVPEEVPAPGELVISMIVERDGSVSKCVVERTEGAAAQAAASMLCDDVGTFAPPQDADGNPQRRRIRVVTSIEHQTLP